MLCVCDGVVLTGVIWPAHAHQSSITSSSLTAVYFIDSHVLFYFALLVHLSLSSTSTSSSASTALLLADKRERTEVVRTKENLRDRHLV